MAASHDYVAANKHHHNTPEHLKLHFEPVFQWMSGKCGEALLKHYDYDPTTTTCMDFACGAGLVAWQLQPHVQKLVGVDLAQQLVDQFNARAKSDNFDTSKFYAVQRDELKDDDGDLDGEKFDVVICTQSFHHMPDLDAIVKALSRRLKSGGALMVIDFDSTLDNMLDAASKEIQDDVAHKHGFSREKFKAIFEDTDRFSSVTIEALHSTTFGELRAFGGEHNPATKSTSPDDTTLRWQLATAIRK
ncbi:hypothetical protein OIV83_001369 [Microbotryomycetes sp. JL201]|nr:hypothetical protein OIV83_001369 [Microbotryomycetes sp. JL201]